MSDIQYISQNSLLEYLKLLYAYIKEKSSSGSGSGSGQSTPAVEIQYKFIVNGKSLDGNWDLVSTDKQGLYYLKKVDTEGIYINGVKQNNNVEIRTVTSNHMFYYSSYYYNVLENYTRTSPFYFIFNDKIIFLASYYLYDCTPFGQRITLSNDNSNLSAYFRVFNNKLYRMHYSSNKFTGMYEIDSIDFSIGQYTSFTYEQSQDLSYNYIEYNGEILCIYKKYISSSIYNYYIYKLNLSTGELTLKYNLPSSYTNSNKGFYSIIVHNGSLYGIGTNIFNSNESVSERRAVYKLVGSSFVLDSSIVIPEAIINDNSKYYLVSIKDKLYCLNWYGSTTTPSYCFSNNTWKQITNPTKIDTTTRLIGYDICVYNDKMYLTGGTTSTSNSSNNNYYGWVYNEDEDIWDIAKIDTYEIVQ